MVKLEAKKFVKTWPTHSLCCCLFTLRYWPISARREGGQGNTCPPTPGILEMASYAAFLRKTLKFSLAPSSYSKASAKNESSSKLTSNFIAPK